LCRRLLGGQGQHGQAGWVVGVAGPLLEGVLGGSREAVGVRGGAGGVGGGVGRAAVQAEEAAAQVGVLPRTELAAQGVVDLVVEEAVDEADPDALRGLQEDVEAVVDLGEVGLLVGGVPEEDGEREPEQREEHHRGPGQLPGNENKG